MIIATAGHVDHGKTSLVRQLTGVETDTLAEERARGLTINLGYAYLPHDGDPPIGFIDVPGHRRFVNTMISGVSGIDLGLLVVAADDGPMPQTAEHLNVLDLLGVDRLVVVISKVDRVDDIRLAEVQARLVEELSPHSWADVSYFYISNLSGEGIADLKTHLLQLAKQIQRRDAPGGFRLSIDRSFSVKGAGLVVTGTASAGRVSLGDTLKLLPAGIDVRVRGVRAHDREVDMAAAGQRVALNLGGSITASDIERGDWLVDPNHDLTSDRLDVVFNLLGSVPFSLKHLSPVKLHLGAKRIAGRIAIIESPNKLLRPGDQCLAQLILEQHVNTVLGERFVLRDHAEQLVLGGGEVLDPIGPRYGKSRAGRLTWLRALQQPTAEASLSTLIESQQLVDMDHFTAIRNGSISADQLMFPQDAQAFDSEGHQWLVHRGDWEAAVQLLMSCVEHWHAENPHSIGIKMTALKQAMAQHQPRALTMAVLVSRVQTGDLVLQEGHIRTRHFRASVSVEIQSTWQALEQHLKTSGLKVPLVSELVENLGVDRAEILEVSRQAIREGRIHRISDNRLALPEQVRHFAHQVRQAEADGDELSVVNLKARFGCGRNLAIEILEYFDSVRFTRRKGNARVVIGSLDAKENIGRL